MKPVTVVAWIRVLTILYRLDTEVVVSNFARGMDITAAFVYVVVECAGGVHEGSCGAGGCRPHPRLISKTLIQNEFWVGHVRRLSPWQLNK